MEDEGIILSSFHQSVPTDVVEKVRAEQSKLANGQDMIFAGPLLDQNGNVLWQEGAQATDQDLLTMRVLVQGVVGKIPE